MNRRLATAGHFSCWTVAAAIVALVASFALSTISVAYLPAYWGWIVLALIPLGAMLGFVAAWKTRESPKIHRTCRVLGLILALVGITMAIVFAEKAGALPETGMFPSFVDAVFAVLFGILAVIGILVMGIAGFGTAALRHSPTGE